MAAPEKPKLPLPFLFRLRAWWDGYDADELAEKMGLAFSYKPEARPRAAPAAPAAKPVEQKVPVSGLAVDPWDKETLDIAQYIWGEGFCGPGGPEYIISMSKLLALSPEMSMIQIGASIGGPMRTLVERFGVWMQGYEESQTLVDAGNELSKMAGMVTKASLVQYEPDDKEWEGFDRKFDRALAKESLFVIEDKKKIIASVAEKLKPGGLFLITDYVLGSDSATTKDHYTAWKVGERTTPYPVMADDLVDMLKSNRLQVRVSEDISVQYIELINKAWAGAEKVAAQLAQEENGAHLIKILMQEAEFWTRRKKMLDSGDLKLWRIVANQKSGGVGMMSDW